MDCNSPEAGREILITAGGGMEVIVRWFNWRTFSPDKRAESAVSEYGAELWRCLEELRRNGATAEQAAEWQAGFVKRWLAYQHAGSRTMNWMITGPARFPVERNNKRMETEHKRSAELSAWIDGRSNWLRRKNRSIERAAKSEAAKTSGAEFQEMEARGVRLIHNTALDRVQLVFPDKPDEETRSLLKSNAFRWSPREGAWQRQLTRNGILAAQGVLACIEERAMTEAA